MKIVAADSQILSSFSRCPRRCKFAFVERLTPKEESKSLVMGKAVHSALESYYRNAIAGMSYAERVDKAIDAVGDYTDKLSTDDMQTVLQTLAEYFRFRKSDAIIPLEVESVFSKILYEGEEYKILLEGRIDLIANISGNLFVLDHKTTSRNSEVVDLNPQFMIYSWATELPVIVNRIGFQKSLKPEEKFKRFPIRFEKRAIEDFLNYATETLYHYALCLDGREFMPNFASCESKYGVCSYINICRYPSLEEETRKHEFVIAEPWDIFKEKIL